MPGARAAPAAAVEQGKEEAVQHFSKDMKKADFRILLKIEKNNSFLQKIVSHLEIFEWRQASSAENADIVLEFSDISSLDDGICRLPAIDKNISIWGPWHYKCPGGKKIIASWGLKNPSRAVIDTGKKSIRFFISPYHWDKPELVPIRFIKGAIYLLLLYSDIYSFHSSCLSDRAGNAYMFIAPSGQGKSTVLRNLLKEGFRWIADDQVFLKAAGEKIWAFSIFNQVGRNNDINLARELGSRNCMSSGAFLKSVVVLSVSPSEKTRIVPLAGEEVEDIFRRSRQFFNSTYLESDHAYLKQLYERWSGSLMRTCRFFRMECGGEVKDDPGLLHGILKNAAVF